MSSGAIGISGVVSSACAAAFLGTAIAVAVSIEVHEVESAHVGGLDGFGVMVVLLWNDHEDLEVLSSTSGFEVISGVTGRDKCGGSDGKEFEEHFVKNLIY